MRSLVLGLIVACGAIFSSTVFAHAAEPEWKVGTAVAKITPEKLLWMAGYAARKKPAEGVAQDLFAKALAVEDKAGARLVLVTLDLIGVPRKLREAIEAEAGEKFKLPPASLLMNASHTHCGPELRVDRMTADGREPERVAMSADYADDLRQKLIAIIGQALVDLKPAKLDYLHARAGFAMNRRRPTDKGYQNAPNSEGPVDHDVPVLRITGEDGKLRAVLFGYACHNTTLSFYQFCGDYAGFSQEYLQEALPGATAHFITGCGGDQNPYPRGTIELCRQHGRALCNGVLAALDTVPKPIGGPLRTTLDEATLDFAPPPSREELMSLAESGKEPQASHSKRLLKELQETGRIRETYPYKVHVVRFGTDLVLVALAGEVVVDYSLRLKRELAGPTVWVAGYSNDVFGYVPSKRVLLEGGYEAGGAMLYGSLPGPFAPTVEERIISKVHELAK